MSNEPRFKHMNHPERRGGNRSTTAAAVRVFVTGCLFLGVLLRAAESGPTLNIGSTPGFPGASVSVPMNIRRATNIVAAQFDVFFDPNKAAAGEPSLGSRHSDHRIRSRQISSEQRRVLIYSLRNALLRTNGFNGGIPFQLSADERVSSGRIAPQNAILARHDATAITPVELSAGTIFAGPIQLRPDGVAELFFPSVEDQRYVLQATTNLVHWTSITTNVASGSFLDMVDGNALHYPQRFYRLKSE